MSRTELLVKNNDRGFYATKSIPKGELIFEWEAPLIGIYNFATDKPLPTPNIPNMLTHKYNPNKVTACLSCAITMHIIKDQNLLRRVKHLRKQKNKKISCKNIDSQELMDIHNIVSTNYYALNDIVVPFDGYANILYYKASMLNHQCVNFSAEPVFSRGYINFIALRDVSPGEQITHPYLFTEYMTVSKRKREIKKRFDFECICNDCRDHILHPKPDHIHVATIMLSSLRAREISLNEKISLLTYNEEIIKSAIGHTFKVRCCVELLGFVHDFYYHHQKEKLTTSEDSLKLLNFGCVYGSYVKTKLDQILSLYLRSDHDINWFYELQRELSQEFHIVLCLLDKFAAHSESQNCNLEEPHKIEVIQKIADSI